LVSGIKTCKTEVCLLCLFSLSYKSYLVAVYLANSCTAGHSTSYWMCRYDIWSVGVVMLELIVGSPHVFQISDRTRVLMDRRLKGWSEQTKELAYKWDNVLIFFLKCDVFPFLDSKSDTVCIFGSLSKSININNVSFWMS
jgi:hypothetical protein